MNAYWLSKRNNGLVSKLHCLEDRAIIEAACNWRWPAHMFLSSRSDHRRLSESYPNSKTSVSCFSDPRKSEQSSQSNSQTFHSSMQAQCIVYDRWRMFRYWCHDCCTLHVLPLSFHNPSPRRHQARLIFTSWQVKSLSVPLPFVLCGFELLNLWPGWSTSFRRHRQNRLSSRNSTSREHEPKPSSAQQSLNL